MPVPKRVKIELLLSDDAESEVSAPFMQGMVNRMMVSLHKYGKVADAMNRTISN